MEHDTPHTPHRATRALAVTSGALILTAATAAVIIKGDQDFPTALLTGAMAFGVLIGAIVVGRAWSEGRFALAIAITLALVCGEAFSLFATGERIVAQRETAQAAVRTKKGGHDYAAKQLTTAQAAFDDATRAQMADASKAGCKAHCKEMHAGAVKLAAHDLEQARKLYGANPEPKASASPLADRLGWQPWAIDLLIAGLLSVAANGLATFLIAYGSHGNRHITSVAEQPAIARTSRATGCNRQPPQPPKGGNRAPVAVAPVATKAAAEADIIRLVARGEEIPSRDTLARRWNIHKATASRWVRDFEARGLVARQWDGRHKRVAAA